MRDRKTLVVEEVLDFTGGGFPTDVKDPRVCVRPFSGRSRSVYSARRPRPGHTTCA